MKLKKIDPATKINPLAKEIKLGFDKNYKKSVLLLHGFGGRCSNWAYTAENISEKLKAAVYVPRLPGHGTNINDFLNSNANQWLRKAVDSYLQLNSEFQEIYLAGLSMGGLLAAVLAANFKFKKLSLIAPAFFTLNKNIVFTPYLKYFIKKIDNEVQIDENNLTAAEINFQKNYGSGYYTKTLAELYKLIKKAKRSAAKIKTPTQLILTKKDEQVDNQSIERFLNKKIGQFLIDKKIYQKSSHVIINDLEKEKAAADIISFFKA